MTDPDDAPVDPISALCTISSELMVLGADMREVKERLGILASTIASVDRRLDRIGADVGQIGRCLDERAV
jgi:hypothetical protein